jgi:hypothetical protein
MTTTVHTREAGQALVAAYRKVGRTAYLLVFPDGRFMVRIS